MMDQELKPDAFLTPLLYAFNTIDTNVQVLFGDKPTMIFREQIGRTLTIKKVKELFDMTCDQWENKNLSFNPLLQMPDITVKPRVQYMTETLR